MNNAGACRAGAAARPDVSREDGAPAPTISLPLTRRLKIEAGYYDSELIAQFGSGHYCMTAALLREAAAALAQRDVPREPTPEMIAAWRQRYPWTTSAVVIREAWQAMYDAAPQERSDAQRDDDARDAARYRWLRKIDAGQLNVLAHNAGPALDAAIDARNERTGAEG